MKIRIKKYIAAIKLIPVLLLLTNLFSGCETFKGDIPVTGDIPEIVYISPANKDGIQDSVQIPVTIPELKGLKIAGYSLTVQNDSGTTVYSEGTPKAGGKKTFDPSKIKEITWSGIDDKGSFVPDGVYYLGVEVWDNNKNKGASPRVKIIVDNTPPEITVTLPFLVFSPDNDGKQDMLPVTQINSSAEAEWKGIFTDTAAKPVRTLVWKGIAPDFSWDGKNDNAEPVPQGEYAYTIASKDLAGNSFSYTVRNIEVDNSKYPINITLAGTVFSPNNDGINDTITFRLEAEAPGNITSSSVDIIDTTGRIKTTLPPPKTLPGSIDFNGKNNNIVLSDGQYFAKFTATYKNGSTPSVVSGRFTIDTKPPHAVVTKNTKVFSPDGDGKKDTISIMQSSSVEKIWTGIILDKTGAELNKLTWQNRAVVFDWDGKDSTGKTVPDGEYSYVLSSTDEGGNSFRTTLQGIVVDTRPTPVYVKIPNYTISPNDDGIDDFARIIPELGIRDGYTEWKLTMADSQGKIITKYEGTGDTMVPEDFTWNGANDEGKTVEGSYVVRLEVAYEKGNIGTAVAEMPLVVDITPPDISVKLSALPFSPDNDGENDTLSIQVSVKDPSGVKDWSATIKDQAGTLFLKLKKSAFTNITYIWDGKSQTGELVLSASDYHLEINAEDSAGNKSRKEEIIPVDILVIRDGDKLKISISSIYFKAYTADYLGVSPDLVKKNLATLDRLADILKKYGNYNIRLEGHAVRVFWNDAKKWETEERDILLPLSKNRAETIRDALIKRGIDRNRMTTYGFGGYQPIVPHSDLVNQWKNRRVEFILIKK